MKTNPLQRFVLTKKDPKVPTEVTTNADGIETQSETEGEASSPEKENEPETESVKPPTEQTNNDTPIRAAEEWTQEHHDGPPKEISPNTTGVKTDPQKAPATKKAGMGGLLGGTALVTAIITLAAGLMLAKQINRTEKEQASQQIQLRQKVQNLEATLTKLGNRKEHTEEMEQTIGQLQSTMTSITETFNEKVLPKLDNNNTENEIGAAQRAIKDMVGDIHTLQNTVAKAEKERKLGKAAMKTEIDQITAKQAQEKEQLSILIEVVKNQEHSLEHIENELPAQ